MCRTRVIQTTALLLVAALLPVAALAAQQHSIASKLVRLHVIANSDSEYDQTVKLAVRDAVLDYASGMSQSELPGSLDDIRCVAESTLHDRGCDLSVRVFLGSEQYSTRNYDNFSLPAGRYDSLRVEIGDADGHNWWCVLFPPLCFASSEEFVATAVDAGMTEEEICLITEDSKDVQIRFRIFELLQNFAHFLFD